MTRHHFRESIKSFFGSHIDPEKDEQLKGSKTELEDKVKKILNLVREEDLEEKDGISIDNSGKEPLVELIEDFYKEYQSLFARYDHLTGELRKKFHSKKEAETSSSSSDSDSENETEDKSRKNGQLEGKYQKITKSMKQDLEMAKREAAELKSKLTATTEEKEALNVEHQTTLSEIQETEEIIQNLKLEVERLDAEKMTLLADNGELNQKFVAAGKIEAELNQQLKDTNKERDSLIVEKEIAMRRIDETEKTMEDLKMVADRMQDEKVILGLELKSTRAEISNMKQELQTLQQQVSDLTENLAVSEEENKSLTSKVSQLNLRLEDTISEKDNLIMEKENSIGKILEAEKTTEDLRTFADQLQDEKASMVQELEALRGEFLNVKQQLESAEKKMSDLTHSLKVTEEENNSLTLKVSELSNEVQQAENRIQELVAGLSQLQEKLGEREREFSSLVEKHEKRGNESSVHIKELEAQVTALELELESVRNQNRDMELQIESKVTDVKQMGEKNLGLQARISELEIMSKERGDELSSLTKKLENNETESLTRVESLTAQINNLLADIDSLRAQKAELEGLLVSKGNEASTEVKGLSDQVNVLQQKLETLHSQKAELEVHLEKKTHQISECLFQLENLKEEMVIKMEDQNKILEEKESLTAQKKDLVLEMETICNQRNELEDQVRTILEQNGRLREEKVSLREKVSELEKTITETGLEFSALQAKHTIGESEASAQIMALTSQATNLQQEFDYLQTEKTNLQLQLDREKQEFTEELTKLENQKTEFMSQIADQLKLLLEQEEAYKKLSEEHKQVEDQFQACKASLEEAEKKVAAITVDFHKRVGSKDQLVAELEETVDDLKRDLEVKGDELNTLVDYVRTIEVKLRLSNQKLRVTEQLLAEKEENFKEAEEKYRQEQKALEERIAMLSVVIAANTEAYQSVVTDVSEKVNNTLTRMEALTQKIEEDSGKYDHCILEMSNEILNAKNWVMELKYEKEQLGKKACDLSMQLEDTRERELAVREKARQLEVKASKEKAEKEDLSEAVNRLEKKVETLEKMMKEKNDCILNLGEEKREAIRQLCLWIDYHRSRYDSLREEILSKMPMRAS